PIGSLTFVAVSLSPPSTQPHIPHRARSSMLRFVGLSVHLSVLRRMLFSLFLPILAVLLPAARAQVTFNGAQFTVPASGLASPSGVAVDAAGDVYIADHGNRIVKVPAGGGVQITVPLPD